MAVCNDTGLDEDDLAEEAALAGSVNLYRVEGVDPRYAVIGVPTDDAGTENGDPELFSIEQDQMPAEVWTRLQEAG
ncbi:hypothetical protein KIH74_07490 [Kineosporia sp. J2-2]|uniref:Uncharacterized protein n=1 Tax=Kineosporia corallincola TaxID=2835133 RepID=A0ABS5TFA0_9ACTN|nr:hypothetical protein [Kineosporia corallincola]MBT0768763.1 hypothetical protein [Kineosporia corallincola]